MQDGRLLCNRPINTIFTIDSPANNIIELLNYLKDTYQSSHTFRGQTNHYETLIPSAYRKLANKEHMKRITIPINVALTDTVFAERERVKIRNLDTLISAYGIGVGNIIAQQYGSTSECLDITSDPEIAAFFATRQYPRYSHFIGTPEVPLGVIYRFNLFFPLYDQAGLEFVLGAAGKSSPGGDYPIWFMKRISSNRISEQELIRILQEREHVIETLFTHPATITFDFIKKSIYEHYENLIKKLKYKENVKKPTIMGNASKNLDNSRIGRQLGGFLLPSTLWKCIIPKERKTHSIPEINSYIYEPSYAIGDLVAIENLLQYPKIEVFYFWHTKIEIDKYSREYLWPGSDEDDFLKQLLHMITFIDLEYFDKHNCTVDDINYGIIDRGYYDIDVGP